MCASAWPSSPTSPTPLSTPHRGVIHRDLKPGNIPVVSAAVFVRATAPVGDLRAGLKACSDNRPGRPAPTTVVKACSDGSIQTRPNTPLELADTQKESYLYTLERMRTNIDIDDDLMRDAMRASGAPTKRAAVERGLRLLVQTARQAGIRRLKGAVRWSGDLAESRRGRAAR